MLSNTEQIAKSEKNMDGTGGELFLSTTYPLGAFGKSEPRGQSPQQGRYRLHEGLFVSRCAHCWQNTNTSSAFSSKFAPASTLLRSSISW
jgi:hypothetical protein